MLWTIHRRRMNSQTFNVLQLGIAFFLIFFAFNSASFIEEIVIDSFAAQGTITKHAGYNSLAIIYAVFTVCNFFAAPVVHKIGARWAMVLGGCSYALFQCGFLFLNEPYLYVTSAVLGFGAAVIWTAQGKYLSLNSTEETAGKHSGLFWATSQACLACGGVFLFFVFHKDSDVIDESTIHILYGVFTSVTILGIILMFLLRMPSTDMDLEHTPSLHESEEPKLSQVELFHSTIQLCKTKRMLLLIVVFMYTGIELSFWSGIYPTCIGFTKQLASNTKRLIALNAICQGLGQATGGFIFGILGAKVVRVGRRMVIYLATTINMIMFVAIYINFPSDAPLSKTNGKGIIEPQVSIALICGFLLGFGDACWNTQVFAFLLSKYPKHSAQAFSIFKFFQSLLTCAAFFYGTTLYLETHLIILAAGAVLGCVCFTLAEGLADDHITQPSNLRID